METKTQLKAGKFHNEALEYYRKTSPLGVKKQDHLAKREFILAIDSLKTFVLSLGFKPEEVNSQTSNYLQFIERNGYYYLLNENDTLNEGKFTCFVILLNHAVNNGNISVKLYNSITRVNEMIFYGQDSDEILKFVNSLNTDDCRESDRLFLSTFISVYNSSFKYWERNANELTKTDGTIIADAVGALHGLLLGPVVSIIEGAVCSIAHEHGWWS